jgi:sulfatase maturation enzyme AslB (radical SAM superfamily)
MVNSSVAIKSDLQIIIPSDQDSVHHLTSALEACARQDIHWSNEFFYRWLSAPGKKWKIFPLRSQDTTMRVDDFEVVVRVQRKAFDRATVLEQLAGDYRFPGVAVGLARWLAKGGRYADALAISKKALAGIEGSTVKWERTMAGKRVHRALQRYLGDDDGYMLSRTCEHPFNRIDLQENGNAAVCCAHWMPGFSLGNVISGGQTAMEIYNDEQAVAVRQSVLDGSFRYCDHDKCPLISGQQLPSKADVPGENAQRAVATGELKYDSPSFVLLAFDQSCNLSCPSCRSHVITEKIGMQTLKEKLVEDSIVPMLKNAKTLNINPAGEIFVSRPLRRLLSKLNKKDFPNLEIEIITNGTLFTRREWEKFPGIHGMVSRVRVSTDGATKETFEKLRRGGEWETFIENMHFLAELHRSGAIGALHFSFTYQLDNFREMPLFVDITGNIDPARVVIFEKLENWGTFKQEDYVAKAVHHLEHPLNDEFLSIIRQPKMKPYLGSIFADYEGLL